MKKFFFKKLKFFFFLSFLTFSLVGCSDTKSKWYDPYINKISTIFTNWDDYNKFWQIKIDAYFDEIEKNKYFQNWTFTETQNIKNDFDFKTEDDFNKNKLGISFAFANTNDEPTIINPTTKKSTLGDVIIEGYFLDPTIDSNVLKDDAEKKDFLIPVSFTFKNGKLDDNNNIDINYYSLFDDNLLNFCSFNWKNIENFITKNIKNKTKKEDFHFDESNFSQSNLPTVEGLEKDFINNIKKVKIKGLGFTVSTKDSTKLETNKQFCENVIVLYLNTNISKIYNISINLDSDNDFNLLDDINKIKFTTQFFKLI